jgi:hypothetical protein
LEEIYDVKDFSPAQFTLSIPKPVEPSIPNPQEPSAENPYVVLVNDNFHYMDEDERYRAGDFATLGEAVQACRKIVDVFLQTSYKPGMASDKLYDLYVFIWGQPVYPRTRISFFLHGITQGSAAMRSAREQNRPPMNDDTPSRVITAADFAHYIADLS